MFVAESKIFDLYDMGSRMSGQIENTNNWAFRKITKYGLVSSGTECKFNQIGWTF